ncbi:MAG: hypothetical protein M3154_06245, partial [Candidatus Eremiobacteraeota bacterium]|nr:hypothetical protein [Candidatus Eremiobacteraeota bacterium]
MTTLSLHATPRARTVAIEQLRAVGVALRGGGIAFLLALAAGFAFTVAMTLYYAGTPNMSLAFTFAPSMSAPTLVIALLLPFGVWRSEEPSQRAYHWSMPVPWSGHALAKLAGGWVWMMLAVAIYLAWFVLLGAVVHLITGEPLRLGEAAAWWWLLPFTAATASYLFGSIALIGSNHP